MSIDELIKAGPVKPDEIKTSSGTVDFKDTDDEPISMDAFQNRKEGILTPEIEKTLIAEEEKAKKEEEANKSKDDNREKVSDTKGLQTDSKTTDEVRQTTKPESSKTEKETASSGGADDALLHLELGISPNSANFFKKMDKSAREFVISELKTRGTKITELNNKLKEAQVVKSADGNNLPPTWYEHPQAVTLLPDYQQVLGGYNKVAGIIQHYRQQFLANRNGDVWSDVVVDKDGNVSYAKYKAGDAAEEHINQKILEYTQLQGKLESKAQLIQANFNQNHIRSAQQIKAIEEQYFPQYADEKALDNNEYYKAITNAFQKFGLDSHLTSGLMKRLYVWAMEGTAENETLKTKISDLEKKVGVVAGKTNNGPTGDEINRGEASKGKIDPDDEEVDMHMFDKLLQRG